MKNTFSRVIWKFNASRFGLKFEFGFFDALIPNIIVRVLKNDGNMVKIGQILEFKIF